MSNEPYVVNLEAPAAIIEKDSRRSDETRKRVGEIDSTLTLSSFELGDLFAEIKANGYFRDWKFESFDDYLKKSGVDMSPRQAAYVIQISNVSKTLSINKSSLAKAKNSKLKEIFSLDHTLTVTDSATLVEESMGDIMRKLVEDAPNRTLIEIKAIVKRLKGEVEEESDGLTWMHLPVRRDAKSIVTQAIDLAVTLSGGTVDAQTKEVKDLSQASAIERICADFLASPDNQVDEFSNDESSDYEDEMDDTGGDDSQVEDEFDSEDEDGD